MVWNTAKGVRARGKERGGGVGVRRVQPRDVQNRAVQQVAGHGEVSIRRQLSVRARDNRAASGDQAPKVQDGGLPHGSRRRHVSLRPPLPLPPLSY